MEIKVNDKFNFKYTIEISFILPKSEDLSWDLGFQVGRCLTESLDFKRSSKPRHVSPSPSCHWHLSGVHVGEHGPERGENTFPNSLEPSSRRVVLPTHRHLARIKIGLSRMHMPRA